MYVSCSCISLIFLISFKFIWSVSYFTSFLMRSIILNEHSHMSMWVKNSYLWCMWLNLKITWHTVVMNPHHNSSSHLNKRLDFHLILTVFLFFFEETLSLKLGMNSTSWYFWYTAFHTSYWDLLNMYPAY